VTGRLAQADGLEAHAGPPGRPDSQTPSPGMAYVAYMMRIPAGHPVTRLLGLTSSAVRTKIIRQVCIRRLMMAGARKSYVLGVHRRQRLVSSGRACPWLLLQW
jgi:hypothetical protein